MKQVKTFRRNNKDTGPRSWWGGHDPIQILDLEVNEFCRDHKVIDIKHFPASDHANRYYVIVYEL